MEHLDKDLQRALEDLRMGRASLEEVRSMAADLGNRHFASGIPDLVQLLEHEDSIVRYNAVNSLAFEFHYKNVADRLLAILARDSDEDCRRIAAAALGDIFQNSRDRRALSALANPALYDLDDDVRKSAYKALLIVNGVSQDEHVELLRSQTLLVDAARVKAILTEVSG
jgi:hypothetical protein